MTQNDGIVRRRRAGVNTGSRHFTRLQRFSSSNLRPSFPPTSCISNRHASMFCCIASLRSVRRSLQVVIEGFRSYRNRTVVHPLHEKNNVFGNSSIAPFNSLQLAPFSQSEEMGPERATSFQVRDPLFIF